MNSLFFSLSGRQLDLVCFFSFFVLVYLSRPRMDYAWYIVYIYVSASFDVENKFDEYFPLFQKCVMIEGYLYLFPLAVSLLIPFAYILS